jgi:hypothetical protein
LPPAAHTPVARLTEALIEVLEGLEDLRGALRQTNDPEINNFFGSLVDTASAVVSQQRRQPSATVADDLANIYSLVSRRALRRSDPELGELQSLSALRAARGNLIADLNEALLAASNLGLHPSDPRARLLPSLQVERVDHEGRLTALDQRLSSLLRIIDEDIRPQSAPDVAVSRLQTDLVQHYSDSMEAEVSFAMNEASVPTVVDLIALSRAVDVIGRLTASFLATVRGAAAKFAETLRSSANLVVRPVKRVVSGTQALVRRVLLARQSVLVAEVPRSGDRWKQVNFDQGTYRRYFGVPAGVAKHVTFRQIRNDGSAAPPEQRVAVTVASKNYRFEVGAASGVPYPTNGHPIVVFDRVAESEFHYMLLLPGEPGYIPVQSLLKRLIPNPSGKRRVVMSVGQLWRAWPTCPLVWAGAKSS